MKTGLLMLTTCLLVVPAYAKYSGGTGEPNDPYQIATADDLMSLGASPGDYTRHFILVADIDLGPHFTRRKTFDQAVVAPITAVSGWRLPSDPRSADMPFTGVLDGAGHTISNLTIAGGDYLGLFGRLGEHAKVTNLAVVDVNVIGSGYYVGGLVGLNEGRIRACYVTGEVRGDFRVGGFAGGSFGVITACYAQARVGGPKTVGGFIGSAGGTIVRCYATGQVVYTEGCDFLGGFAGEGGARGAIAGCLWDTEASGMDFSACGIGFDTAALMDSDAYALNGWPGDPNWVLDAGRDYPRLAWEGNSGQAIGDPVISDRLAGSGTPEEPYEIATADQLALVGSASVLWDKALVLAADLDVNGIQINRIGISPGSEFRGSFDGRAHTIRNLTMDSGGQSAWWMGLFGLIHDDGRVSNLKLEHAVIKGGGQRSAGLGALAGLNYGSISNCTATDVLVEGQLAHAGISAYLGGLVGYNRGSIDHCRVDGNVTADMEAGGLVGLNHGNIIRCRADTTVSGRAIIGGLVGCNLDWSTLAPGGTYSIVTRAVIKDSCATGQVAGDQDSYDIGGLVGSNQGSDLAGCHATGAVSGQSDVGGLVGHNAPRSTITNSYATGDAVGRSGVGGLVAVNAGTITACHAAGKVAGDEYVGGLAGWDWDGNIAKSFWDVQTSGVSESAGGTGKTTTEMQTAETFLNAGWDFVGETVNGTEDVWWIDEGKDYPRLWWEAK